MIEEDARAWLSARFGAGELAKLHRYVELLVAEAGQQNLVAASTIDAIWARHIVDSAQLVAMGDVDGNWVDLGSGAGLPGIVVAILRHESVILVEPRRRRAEFLDHAVTELALANAKVLRKTAAQFDGLATTVSARAVASMDDLFAWTQPNVSRETTYILPRGRSAANDLEIAKNTWHGSFHVEQSATDPSAGIIIARGVSRR